MAETDLTTSDPPFAVSPKEAARRLSIGVSTLYRHYGAAMRGGQIRTLKIGRSIRIVWASLLAYIERNTRSS